MRFMKNINFFFWDKLKSDLYRSRYAILILIVYCVVMQMVFNTVCPFKAITGINCPACGLTHAAFYFFTGRFSLSFKANPTFIFWFLTILLFLIDRYIKPLKIKPFPVLFIIVCLITLVYYFTKILVIGI